MSKHIEEQYKSYTDKGVDRILTADILIKRSENEEEFLTALGLLADATMMHETHGGILKLSHVHRTFHRTIKKIFGDMSLMEALVVHYDISPVEAVKAEGLQAYSILRKYK